MRRAAAQDFPVQRLKYVVDPARPITYGIVQCGPDYPGGVPYIRPADMTDEGGVEDSSLLLRTDPEIAAAYARSTVVPGDLVISIGPSFGKVMVVPPELAGANLTQGTARIAVERPANARFVFWALRSTKSFQQWESSVGGATFRALNLGPLSVTSMPMPDPQRQRAIADYLDRETVRLDALVAAKERVLRLLAEKRRALITRAVTRGLDPRAPLRDSGIPWLGEIPAHWETSKFTWSVFIIEGQVDPEIEPYINMPLIAPNHVESGTGRLLSTETAADQGAISGKYLCQRGDVIYSKIRPALRKATIAAEECLCSADMYPLRARDGLQPEFLLLFLLSEPFSTWAVLESNRVAMPKINREALSEIRIPIPPPEEQRVITRHVEKATAKLDGVRLEAERTISLLKERRAALIAAAVTGQLDIAGAMA